MSNVPVTKKGYEWKEFAEKVLDHVENYTVPQYGDTGFDQMEEWSIDACYLAIRKYMMRSGRNARPGQDKLDALKIAHYACFIYQKLTEKEEKDDKTAEVG